MVLGFKFKSPFKKKFFSIGGQKERIKNVGSTLKAALNPFDKRGVKSNIVGTGKASKALVKGIETAASRPYTSALVATTLSSPKIALAGLKKGTGSVLKGIGKRAAAKPLRTAVVAGITVPTGVGLLSNKKIREPVVKTTKSAFNPVENVKRGKNLADIITKKKPVPDSVKDALKYGGIGAAALTAAVVIPKAVSKIKDKLPKKSLKADSPIIPSPLVANPLAQKSPQPAKGVQQPIGEVKKPIKSKAMPTTKVSQKVEVNQKVYKVASVDIKHGTRRRKKRRRRK